MKEKTVEMNADGQGGYCVTIRESGRIIFYKNNVTFAEAIKILEVNLYEEGT